MPYMWLIGLVSIGVAFGGLIRRKKHLAVIGSITAVAFMPQPLALWMVAGWQLAKSTPNEFIQAACFLAVFVGALTCLLAASVFISTILVFKRKEE